MKLMNPIRSSKAPFAAALYFCLSACIATSDEAPSSVAPTMDRVAAAGELSKKALTHLRDEEIEKALEVLGTVADLELPANNRFEDPTGAAAAGLNRALAQLSTDEQYDLLHDWSMPTSDRKTVRVLTSLTPEIGPPMEFARALPSECRP